jgi:DNA invertase Pin-like site-specific DNA recombinase
MLIGYARVSTDDQNLALQRDALNAAGCDQVFEDHGISGTTRTRPGLDSALSALKDGDVLVVWKLDRLGRSLPHLIETLAALGKRGIGFRSLSEAIDTSSAGGRLVFHLMGALAEFERSLIVERTTAGIKAARARGVRVGRRRSLTAAQIAHARLLLDGGERAAAVAKSLNVSRSTLYRALATT